MRYFGLASLLLIGPLPGYASNIEAFPSDVYSDADIDREKKRRIEELMGVYLTIPPRRHRSERIALRGSSVQIDVWHPIGQNSDSELKTRAVQWLVFGRTQYAKGARGIFSEFPEVQRVLLRFHTVTKVDQKGRRKSSKPDQIRPYLALLIDRQRFHQLNVEPLKACIERTDCSGQFKEVFTKSTFKRRYVARIRRQ
ncbi:MAG: hypothetical protein VX589_17465 [Myxococcota bacterium]|nr:hypothetical protein [Myxococcota bacterium]